MKFVLLNTGPQRPRQPRSQGIFVDNGDPGNEVEAAILLVSGENNFEIRAAPVRVNFCNHWQHSCLQSIFQLTALSHYCFKFLRQQKNRRRSCPFHWLNVLLPECSGCQKGSQQPNQFSVLRSTKKTTFSSF